MKTDLDHLAPPAGGLDLLASAGGGLAAAADTSRTVLWAQRVALSARTFDLLIDTPMVPTSFWTLPPGVRLSDWPQPWIKHPRESDEEYAHRRRSTAAATAAAALWGESLGLDVPQSLEGIHVIQGRPGLKAELVLSLLKVARYRVRRLERSATRAALAIAEPDSDEFDEFEFTIDQARKAGFVKDSDHPKGNDKYNTQPEVMLWHRVVTTAARVTAPHVLRGLATDVELEDEAASREREPVTVTATARDAVPAPAASSASDALRAQLAQAPASGNGPITDTPREPVSVNEPVEDVPAHDPATGEVLDPPPADELPVLATDRTKRAIGERFGELGVGGRGSVAARLWLVRQIARDPLVTLDTITEAAAVHVLAQLRAADRAGVRALLEQRPGPDLDDRERSDEPAEG